MTGTEDLQIRLEEYDDGNFDLDRIIYDLDSEIDLLTSQADKYDYLISISSGILSAMLDILWVGEFSLDRGRDVASEDIDKFVIKTANILGSDTEDIQSAVRFLEEHFPVPSDGNTPELGGGLQHHLRDFAHHPSIAGLAFSILTQFTYKSYGTDTLGNFIVLDVTERSRRFIGENIHSKLINGTFVWFFHLVSDMAGSSFTAGKSGGTGIPGPLLSLAKELSALPLFKNITIQDHTLSKFLSKLFNGTLLAKRNENGKMIKGEEIRFDLRGEMGLGIEIGRQAIPVIANESIVRSFYFFRHLALEIKTNDIQTISELKQINWETVRPHNNPTISRMLSIASGVFTSIDVGEALITQTYWVSINYVGVGRFAVAIGEDVSWGLRARNIKKIRSMYKNIQQASYSKTDNTLYKRIGDDMTTDNFGLTIEQTEILYNIEYHKTLNDIRLTKTPRKSQDIKLLKHEWLKEWKDYMTKHFPKFLDIEGAELNWYSKKELIKRIEQNNPYETWFRLVLLEAMLFEPYFPLSVEEDKKGRQVPGEKYKKLQNRINGYRKNKGDKFFETFFKVSYYPDGYVDRLRKTYNKIMFELNETLKTVIKSLSITAVITILTVATAGALAPKIAVILVGSHFAGLHGAALTAASLAYLGGGAVAAGGAGVAGGTMTIVGGGAILGLGVGGVTGGTVGAVDLIGKQHTILQSAKLLVSIREVFLNDEHDIEYSNTVYEQYIEKITEKEKNLVELRMRLDDADDEEKKNLKERIKNNEETLTTMNIARDNLRKFISSFEVGLNEEEI
ncbi:hypothetical protein SAMN04488102_1074 [Alkalibacterium subtropicum]|uniref:Uncharacterized protein n=1 Tax=Alkalibacterium subtropicum TaxID=753702 RepID=A0A1I1J7S0_9LACT|nr:hypothetical protein [Alkalibacterium subtropicum]SFC44032.1 hypothetical protein SAMN04488102_1074 [Alkalibacterium subtropicum]